MGLVARNLAAMGTEQLLLALIFLASYALALGQFAEGRARAGVIGAGVCAAIGFVALSHPWEAGVILLAGAPVAMGLFAGTAWTLWKISVDRSQPAVAGSPAPKRPAGERMATGSMLERLRARLRFI